WRCRRPDCRRHACGECRHDGGSSDAHTHQEGLPLLCRAETERSEFLAIDRATCLLAIMSNQPTRALRDEVQTPPEGIRRYRLRSLPDLQAESAPTWTGTAAMESNGPWNGGRLN